MKCILHIGTEKTGTTLIQDWIYANYNSLSKQRVAVSNELERPNNRKLVAYFQTTFDDYFKQNKIFTHLDKDIFFKDFIKNFKEEIFIKKENHDYFLISSEHFHSRLTKINEIKGLSNFLKSIFTEVKIICYFREQTEVRNSLYTTYLIHHGITQDLNSFQSKIKSSSHYYNYYKMFKLWEKAFGYENLIPLIYGTKNFSYGDIRKDFITKVNSNIDLSKLNYKIKLRNARFNSLQTEMMRVLNKFHSVYLNNNDINVERLFFVRIINQLNFLDEKEENIDLNKTAIYKRFEKSNEKFFKYFFKSHVLFKKFTSNTYKQNELKNTSHNSGVQKNKILRFFELILKNISGKTFHRNEAEFFKYLSNKYESSANISNKDALTLLKLSEKITPLDPKNKKRKEKLQNVL